MGLFQRLLLVVTLAVLPAIIVQAYNEASLRRERIAEAKNLALRLAYQVNDEMDRTVEGARQLLTGLAHTTPVLDEDVTACNVRMAGLRKEYPAYLTLAAADRDGEIFCSTAPPLRGQSMRRHFAFEQALRKDGFAAGRYIADGLAGVPAISFALPFRDTSGEARGIILAELRLDRLAKLLAAKPLPTGVSVVVADGDGTIIASTFANGPWAGHRLPQAMLALLHRNASGVEELTALDGTPLFFGFIPDTLPPSEIFVGVGMAKGVAMAPIEQTTTRAAVLISAGLLLALLIAWVTGRFYIRRPLAALLGAIDRWRDGDYSARAQVDRSVREIAHIVDAFHHLADRLQEREQQIMARDVVLRRAYKSKDLLLAAAGHDLRQPLQTITIALESIGRYVNDDRKRLMLERAGRAVDRMSVALDHLIDVARVELGAVIVETSSFPIGRVLDEIADEWTERAALKGVRVNVVRSSTAVRSDPVMLGIILGNLVGNAVRYTEQGRILVGCRRRRGELVVEVHDTGIGIPADAIPSIFEAFRQLDPAAQQGFGLGLSIVKGMADRLGHPIAVRSRPGAGSCFSITIPLAAAESIAA